MNVLEKISEEIEEKIKVSDDCNENLAFIDGIRYGLIEAKKIICSHMDEAENDGWIPVSERLPEDETEVLVELGYTYESDYTFYSIARFIRFEDGEEHWCDNKAGYLEWDKYSDSHGGNSSYKVLRWMPLPKLKGI